MSEDLRSEEIRKMKLRTLAVGTVGVVGAVYAASRLVPLAIDRAFADSSPREVAAAALSRVPRPSFRKSESAD